MPYKDSKKAQEYKNEWKRNKRTISIFCKRNPKKI